MNHLNILEEMAETNTIKHYYNDKYVFNNARLSGTYMHLVLFWVSRKRSDLTNPQKKFKSL